jgi:hypothetical protein
VRTWRDWHEVHQPFELRYHTRLGIPWCSDEAQFWGHWNSVFDFIGQTDGRSLDIGCGPRPPFGRGSVAIDPLADEYRKLAPSEWWEDIEVFAAPAETFVPDLEGGFDVVMCWNCLDHTIGWRDILANMARYGKPEAVFTLATDFREVHRGHPGFERDDFWAELGRHFEVVREAENFASRDLALVLERREDA